MVDELKTPGAVDRIKADRRVVDEIDKLVALVADHRLHLMACGDVLEDPEAVARPAGDRVDRDVEPAGDPAAGIAQRQRRDRPRPGGCPAAQALEIRDRLHIGERGGEPRQRRFLRLREEIVEGGIGIGNPAIRGEDQLGVGRGVERLAEDVDPAGQCGMGPTRRTAGSHPDDCSQGDDRDRGRRDLGGGNHMREIEDADGEPGRGEDHGGITQQPPQPGLPALGSPTHPATGALGFGHHDLCPASLQSAHN